MQKGIRKKGMMNYFLYFMDKEFLTIRKLDNTSGMDQIIENCIRYILFSSYEKLYISLSAVIECEYADKFVKKYEKLFEKRFFIAMSDRPIEEYLYRKQDQYAHEEEIARKYQYSKFEHLLGLPARRKKTDTTVCIEKQMLQDLELKRDILSNVDYYKEKIIERKKAAITHHLFQDIYRKREVAEQQQYIVNSLITEVYIMTYLEDFDGDIPIPHRMGLQGFSDLSQSYPINDIFFWYTLYDRIGCSDLIEHCSELDMLIIFKDTRNVFTEFIDIVCKKLYSLGDRYYDLLEAIPRMPMLSSVQVEEFLKRIETLTSILLEWEAEKDIEEGGVVLQKERTVFVVHGRNKKYCKAIYSFLKSLDLYPLEWERAVELTGKGAPETLEVVKMGIRNSNGVVVLYTGDEEARLIDDLKEEGEEVKKVLQPRQNVVFEAGYAMSAMPDKTIIVKIGEVDISSDLRGINYVALGDDRESRKNLKNRLRTIGLPVDDYSDDWETAGSFQ